MTESNEDMITFDLGPAVEGLLQKLEEDTGFTTDEIILQALLISYPSTAPQIATYLDNTRSGSLPSFVMLCPRKQSILSKLMIQFDINTTDALKAAIKIALHNQTETT